MGHRLQATGGPYSEHCLHKIQSQADETALFYSETRVGEGKVTLKWLWKGSALGDQQNTLKAEFLVEQECCLREKGQMGWWKRRAVDPSKKAVSSALDFLLT